MKIFLTFLCSRITIIFSMQIEIIEDHFCDCRKTMTPNRFPSLTTAVSSGKARGQVHQGQLFPAGFRAVLGALPC